MYCCHVCLHSCRIHLCIWQFLYALAYLRQHLYLCPLAVSS
jgi:hypothetical protein